MFNLMFVHIILVRFRLLSDHLFGKCCSFGRPYVVFVLYLFVILLISHFGLRAGFGFIFTQVPCHCLLLLQYKRSETRIDLIKPSDYYTSDYHGGEHVTWSYEY